MILTFSRPEFKDKIISGTKTTTIRADKHRRWKVGTENRCAKSINRCMMKASRLKPSTGKLF